MTFTPSVSEWINKTNAIKTTVYVKKRTVYVKKNRLCKIQQNLLKYDKMLLQITKGGNDYDRIFSKLTEPGFQQSRCKSG